MTRLPLPLLPLLLSPPAGAASPPARRLFPAPAAMSAAKTSPASGEYPVPVSPPYPAASKDVELRRAMTASARSAAFASAEVVFEDEWLAVVDKPAGVYCDALLSSLPRLGASGSGTRPFEL
uniref:Pseudouridine synthase RsuA/RluA-like domain-containing protein n=1 Tax=Arundo donax TaxID=35708 RepID=A0A0A9DNQ4_ARUDO